MRSFPILLAAALTIGQLHAAVTNTLDDVLDGLGTGNLDAAERVLKSKAEFKSLQGTAAVHLADRLGASDPQRIEAYSIETSLMEGLRSVHSRCRRIARRVRDLERLGAAESD